MSEDGLERVKEYGRRISQQCEGRPLLPPEASEILWNAILEYDPGYKRLSKLHGDTKVFFMLGFSCGWELKNIVAMKSKDELN